MRMTNDQCVALLQLHNSITAKRGDEPTSLTPGDELGAGGVLEAFRELQAEGLVEHLGLTGIGQPGAMREAVGSGAFDTMQVPFNALNPSAGYPMPAGFGETDYGNIIADCGMQGRASSPSGSSPGAPSWARRPAPTP